MGMCLRHRLPDAYPARVFAIWQDCDLYDDLWVSVDYQTDEIHLAANCNDLFDYATADCESIRPEDVELVERTARELLELDGEIWLGELYAARRRNRQPLPAFLDRNIDDSRVRALFEALPANRGAA